MLQYYFNIWMWIEPFSGNTLIKRSKHRPWIGQILAMRNGTKMFLLFILSKVLKANRDQSQDEHKQEWVWSRALTLMTGVPKALGENTWLSLHFQLLRKHLGWRLGKMYFSDTIHKDVWTVIACNLKKMFSGGWRLTYSRI